MMYVSKIFFHGFDRVSNTEIAELIYPEKLCLHARTARECPSHGRYSTLSDSILLGPVTRPIR